MDLKNGVMPAVLSRNRPALEADPAMVARHTLKRLAIRHTLLRDEIAVIDSQLDILIRVLNPNLLALRGGFRCSLLSRPDPCIVWTTSAPPPLSRR